MCSKVKGTNILKPDIPTLRKLSENEVLKAFRKCNEVCKQQFYFQKLSQIQISIIKGEISQLKKINVWLICIEKELNCLAYRCSPNFPLTDVNIIILACKYSQPDVLEFILSDKCKILHHWPITVGYNAVLPTDIDEYHHSAFYYAIRSGKTKLVEILIEKWPDEYPFQNSGKLHEALSNAYRELKLKNVKLPIEMEVFVRNAFFEKDFYREKEDVQTIQPGQKTKKPNVETHKTDEKFKKDIEKRIELVLRNISTLTRDFAVIDVDETFLVTAKFIAKNIHILKGQLRCTYDTIPWEEMEFCIVIFILTATELRENHLLDARLLNKNRMLMHLTNFGSCLANALVLIKRTNENALKKLPPSKEPGINAREYCVSKIIKSNSILKILYNDYDRVRDEYSLKTMNRYLNLAISVECDAEGRLVITRALQVVGEHFKNTLESPKLSDTTIERLLFLLPRNLTEIIKDLRDALSHADSMSKRLEIESRSDTFFNKIQDDLKKLNTAIVEVLCQCKMRVIRDELKKISKCEKENELKEILKSLQLENVEEELSEIPVLSQLKEIRTLANFFSCNIEEKTQREYDLFMEINYLIDSEINRLDQIKLRMKRELHEYNVFVTKIHKHKFENIKTEATKLLNKTSPKVEVMKLKEIKVFFEQICKCVVSRFKVPNKITHLAWDFLRSGAINIDDMKLIEEYKCNIKQNKRKVLKKSKTELTDNLFSRKLSQLKNVLDNDTFKEFTSFKRNRKYQVVVEMLVLDIYSLLEENMSYNHMFLDDEPVTLIGRSMRKHLAHENALFNIVSSPLIDLALNATKLPEESDLIKRSKIGKPIICNINKLQFEHKQDLAIIALQKEMFKSISSGDIEAVNNTLQNGADVNARYIQHKTSLHFASEGTSLETIKFVLDAGFEFDAKDANGRSALHIAALNGRSNIVEYLIKNTSIYVDQIDVHRKTALHVAAEHGHLKVVKILINSGASTTLQDVHGYSPLHYSIINNHEETVKVLLKLEKNADENDAFGGLTPLYIAVQSGHLGLVNYLIRKNANVNEKTDTLYVPLHAAVQGGHLKIAKSLIENGAKVNSRCMEGTTALHMASTTGQKSIFKLLLKHEKNVNDTINIFRRSPLSFAAEHGNLELVKLLLKNNAKMDLKDVTGKTPLHFAAENGHKSIVEILIQYNASMEVVDYIGFTALHYSAFYGHTSVVRLLIEHGSNINSTDKCSSTPLNLAVLKGHQNVIKFLIDRKANVNNTNFINSTALHECCKKQYLDIAKLLIKNKAEIHVPSLEFGITPFQLALGLGSKVLIEAFEEEGANITDVKTSDFTALHLGIENGDCELIQYIIDSGCDVNAKSKSGLTPLHLAVVNCNISLVELLVKNGSNLDVCDGDGYTPLKCAVSTNNRRIVHYLIDEGATVEDEGHGDLLKSAVFFGLCDMVTILLDTGKFDVNVKFKTDENPLTSSVVYGHKKVAECLIAKGADVNAKPYSGTPLYLATRYGDFEMVKVLLKNNADPNITSREDEVTPLYAAIIKDHVDIVEILLHGGATTKVNSKNETALQLAVENSRLEIIKVLVDNKHGDVNEIMYGQCSLLYIATTNNELEIVKYLVGKKADPNVADSIGLTPIIVAAKKGFKEIVEFLYKFSAENTFREASTLTVAVKAGHLEVTKYLVENCVNINYSSCYNDPILHEASKCNQKDILLYFLNNGAYYNAKDKNRNTPLQVAEGLEIKSALDLVKMLFIAIKRNKLMLLEKTIEEGAILNAKRRDDATPLHYASWKGHCDIVDVLLKNGSKPNIIGKCNSTPLHYAAKFGHFGIVRSLLSHGAIYNIQSYTGKTPLEYSTDKDVTELLSLVDKSFRSVQNGDVYFLDVLKTLRDPETTISVMKSRNKENKLLVTSAMLHDFPKIKQLKQVLEVDTRVMFTMATYLGVRGNYSESLKLFNDIVNKMTEDLGHDHPDTLDIKDFIGEVLLKNCDFDKAFNVFGDNLKIRNESYGANDISTLPTKRNLAFTLHKLEQKSEALKMMQEIYSQQSIIFGKKHSEVLQTQEILASMLEENDKVEEALELFKMAYVLRKESHGENHPKTLMIQTNLAMLLSKQKKHDEAIKNINHVYDIMIEKDESNDLEILRKIADIYNMEGNYHKALQIYKKVLSRQENDSGYTDLNTLITRHSLRNVLFSQKKMLQAFKEFRECYVRGSKELGANHFLTQKATKSMESVRFHFTVLYGEVGCSVLQQISSEYLYLRCGKHEGSLSAEQRIKEASDIYLKHVEPNTYFPMTRFPYEEWRTKNPEELTKSHVNNFITDCSTYQAMAAGDELKETETWTKYADKNIFSFISGLKNKHFGIHKKFDNTGLSSRVAMC